MLCRIYGGEKLLWEGVGACWENTRRRVTVMALRLEVLGLAYLVNHEDGDYYDLTDRGYDIVGKRGRR